MAAKHGAVFFERLSPRSKANPAIPVRSLYLDRSHMGTLAIRDLCAALAASRAPHLKVLSLRCTASKGGMFANKKKHEEMARALGDVVLRCSGLEKLYLSGGDGSGFKGDLVPAMAALEKNASIEVLDISNNACGDDALHRRRASRRRPSSAGARCSSRRGRRGGTCPSGRRTRSRGSRGTPCR